MADAEIQIDTSAFTSLSKKYIRLVQDLDDQVEISVDRIAERSERVFASAARRHGYEKVAAGIFTIRRSPLEVALNATAIDPESGYDYALTTRLGHRVQYIYPRVAKRLRFSYAGKIMYRFRVKAWSPTVDWADEAKPEIRQIVRAEARNLTRRLVRRAS